MQTHAVAWITPNRKHTTRTDQKGHRNPTWNDKFIFALDNESGNATLAVEIYAASWFRDVLVGTVKVPISDLINPLTRTRQNRGGNTRFVALQVRRPSGNPQGMLNMGVALLESTMRSMPLSMFPVNDEDVDNNKELNARIHLWRSLSTGSSVLTNNDEFPIKQGSICNGSEICSDIGPSASIVAVELAKKHQTSSDDSNPRHDEGDHHGETGSSIVEELTVEEAKAKGYERVASRERWRKAAAQCDDDNNDESELLWDNNGRRRSSRRSSDGGLFSCLVYGIEFTIVCGASKNARSNKNSSSNSGSRNKKNSGISSA
ncbi:hypothetical protein PHJA_002498700 [Phtheirospermum japonicum]|uniref:C2 domain-containing protein n=1 Tax=Phtheirospermum japonicum TaxID=374723 RepID=A0A830D141_9LAMI|nr:hypothetical protein PHJA_002498700 [Phtheirospermum japonicum]